MTDAAAAPKKRGRRAAFKLVPCRGTVGAVLEDGLAVLEELGSECREVVDNASEGLSQTQRIQTLEETAGALEGIQVDVDLPDEVSSIEVSYSDRVPTDKRRQPSRATRCANACGMLQAGLEGLQSWLDDEANAEHDKRDEVQALVVDVESALSDAEGCEFPGMFG